FYTSGLDSTRRFPLRQFFQSGFGREQEECPPILAAEHARDRPSARDRYAPRDFSALPNADELVLAEARHPYRAFGVETDPVGRAVAEVSEEAPAGERAVRLHVERGQQVAERLGDDQGLAVRRDHCAIRKRKLVGDDARSAVG